MLRFILKRLLIIIPELFIISVICFFLMHRVTSRFDLRDSEYRNTVIKSRPEANSLSPLFYCSLVPMVFPDTVFLLSPAEQRNRIKSLLYQGYEWDKIKDYLQSEIQISGSMAEINPDFATLLNQTSNVSDLSVLDPLISDSIKNTNEYRNWKMKLNELVKTQSQWKVFIPSFRFHGFHNQYHVWIKKFISGNSGNSKVDNKPVWTKIREALNWTFTLSFISLILIFIVGYFIGEKIFLIKNQFLSKTIDASLFFFDSLPVFFLGMILIYVFASSTVSSSFHIFPTPGFIDIQSGDSFLKTLSIYFSSLILPVICIVLPSLAYLSRLVTRKIREEYKKPYSFLSWAEGKSDKMILRSEIRKNSLLPLVALLGMEIPALISGTVLIEIVFNIPGMGRLTYQSIVLQDWPVVFSILLLTALLTILGKLISDVLIFIFDHRVKINPR